MFAKDQIVKTTVPTFTGENTVLPAGSFVKIIDFDKEGDTYYGYYGLDDEDTQVFFYGELEEATANEVATCPLFKF